MSSGGIFIRNVCSNRRGINSFSRMVRQDGLLPGGTVDVRVDLGGRDAFVTEHILDDTKVGAVLDEMGGERMAESVW